jgi:hypothetical protein
MTLPLLTNADLFDALVNRAKRHRATATYLLTGQDQANKLRAVNLDLLYVCPFCAQAP